YNLAVAVDDRDMGITHVVRGADHLSNTPRQILILRALGADPPVYAHLPLLHGPDGKKLSKRHVAASVQDLRHAGYLPEAVRNYLALLGWGYDESTEFFTTEELIERFSLERVSKSPAVFDEQKLRWMNGHYLRQLPPEELTRRLEERLGRQGRHGLPGDLGVRGRPGTGGDARQDRPRARARGGLSRPPNGVRHPSTTVRAAPGLRSLAATRYFSAGRLLPMMCPAARKPGKANQPQPRIGRPTSVKRALKPVPDRTDNSTA